MAKGNLLIELANGTYKELVQADEGDVITQEGTDDAAFKAPKGSSTTTFKAEAGTVSPASSGKIRWNNATQVDATKLFLSKFNGEGTDITNYYQGLEVGDAIYLQKQTDAGDQQQWGVDLITDVSGDKTVDVTLLKATGDEFSTTGQGEKLMVTVVKNAGIIVGEFASPSPIIASSGTLIKCINYLNTNGGNLVMPLPDPSTVREGTRRFVKRRDSAGNLNSAKLTGHINGTDLQQFVLGFDNESVLFVMHNGSWEEWNRQTACFATLLVITPTTFTLTTGFTKFTGWDTSHFSTPGRLTADHVNNEISNIDFHGPREGYIPAMEFNIEYNNNKTVSAQLYYNDLPLGEPASVNGDGIGVGKPVTLYLPLPIEVNTADKKFDLRLKGESGGTLTVNESGLTLNRIGG